MINDKCYVNDAMTSLRDPKDCIKQAKMTNRVPPYFPS